MDPRYVSPDVIRLVIRALAEKIAFNEACWGPEPGGGYFFWYEADEKNKKRGVTWDAFKGDHPWHKPDQIEAHLLALLKTDTNGSDPD